MKIQNITLEMSLKPFYGTDAASVRSICRSLFLQWLALLRRTDQVSVLLWTADGSEILDYAGRLDDPIEWARYIGVASPKQPSPSDPEGKSVHSRPYLYVDDPPAHSYHTLKTIVTALRREGQEITGKPIRVGATFDPGPEFARSTFKYERHREVSGAETMGPTQQPFAVCYATLHGDDRAYAGFPDGIPEGLPFGSFLGRQCRHFLDDLSFDYIWLSNGFGFGTETWRLTGPTFDSEHFYPEKAAALREQILGFWHLFREECPDHAIETRGTNLSTGLDLGSDAVPLRDIYAGRFNMAPPCNSPWAALNGDFGMELAGYMSHNCEGPADVPGYPFRFYTHDPWWLNSPWLDRYERQPHDIYLPMAVSRIGLEGTVDNPSAIEFLTIDDSYGRMPDCVPNEVLPHILTAVEHAPDAPGPLIWLYPFDEYHDMAFNEGRLDLPYAGDMFIRCAINAGVPLNTVVSTRIFAATFTDHPELYRGRVIVTPVFTLNSSSGADLRTFLEAGGDILLYGPVSDADDTCMEMLGLRLSEPPLEGVLTLRLFDSGGTGELDRGRLCHRPTLSAGGCQAVLALPAVPHTDVLATVDDGTHERVVALTRSSPAWNGGKLAWVRGTSSLHLHETSHGIIMDDPVEFMDGAMLVRRVLTQFGYGIDTLKQESTQPEPVLTVSRQSNAFFFSGYMRDTTTALALRFPQGAPLFVGEDVQLVAGKAVYHPSRAWHSECRIFVEQQEGRLGCRERLPGQVGIHRRLWLSGLRNATVRFYPVPGSENAVSLLRHPVAPFFNGDFADLHPYDDKWGHYFVAQSVSGDALITW